MGEENRPKPPPEPRDSKMPRRILDTQAIDAVVSGSGFEAVRKRRGQKLGNPSSTSSSSTDMCRPAGCDDVHIIGIGNPGSGKSTLLNALIGKIVFSSGISICKGLTKERAVHTDNKGTFVDSPGLADVDNRVQSAKEISKALSGAARCKLLFVVTLEGG